MMPNTTPPPGIHHNVPFADYLKWDAMSQTALKRFARSPAHYKYATEHPFKANAGMEIGKLLDTALFDGPDALDAATVERPEGNGNLKSVQDAKANAAITGRIMVDKLDLAIIRRRVEIIRNHPQAALFLDECEPQVSFVWDDPTTGIRCKGRADLATTETFGGGVIVDLKHTKDAELGAFLRQAANLNYHIQAAFYWDGYSIASDVGVAEWWWLAAEGSEPYCVNAIPVGAATIAAGRQAYSRWLVQYAECVKTDAWPGYATEIEPQDIPIYAIRKEGIDPSEAYDSTWA